MSQKQRDREFDQRLKQAAQQNAEKIEGCEAFIAIFNEDMVKEVIPILQMGLAVYLNKPVYLLVPEDVTISENLRRLAVRIEYYRRTPDDLTSFSQATARLMKDFGKP